MGPKGLFTLSQNQAIFPCREPDDPGHALSFLFRLLNKCNYGDDIEEDEMGGACRTHGRDEKLTQILSVFLNGREPLERFGDRDWREILNR